MVEFLLAHVPKLSVTKERTQILLWISIELTTSALAGVQVAYLTTRATRATRAVIPVCEILRLRMQINGEGTGESFSNLAGVPNTATRY